MTAAHCADGASYFDIMGEDKPAESQYIYDHKANLVFNQPELTMSEPVLSRTGLRSPPSRARPTLSGTQAASMLTLLLFTCQRRSPSANTSGLHVSHREYGPLWKVLNIMFVRASDANEEYVGQLTTPVGWGKNADNAGGITPDLNVSSLSMFPFMSVAVLAL